MPEIYTTELVWTSCCAYLNRLSLKSGYLIPKALISAGVNVMRYGTFCALDTRFQKSSGTALLNITPKPPRMAVLPFPSGLYEKPRRGPKFLASFSYGLERG